MRLINTTTYRLKEQVVPEPYAILSHTWRHGEELSYTEFVRKRGKRKSGYRKIVGLCTLARSEGINHAWIDTVCIDKSSSAELSEAINSMFSWYKEAQICYVFIDDTDDVAGIEHCRWLTRGWTLQELLAPSYIHFYDRNWTFLGTKSSLVCDFVRWTSIDQIVLERPSMMSYVSVAARMSWAASRRTSRVEDLAYCLLGIFNVNMPLLYGEKTNAFRRLQEEILRQSGDISLLAFDRTDLADGHLNLLAPDPDAFGKRPKIINEHNAYDCELTSAGVKTSLRILKPSTYITRAILPCRFEFDPESRIFLDIYSQGPSNYRLLDQPVGVCSYQDVLGGDFEAVTLIEKCRAQEERMGLSVYRHMCRIRADVLISKGYEVTYAETEVGIKSWDEKSLTSEIITYGNIVAVRKFGFVHQSYCEAFIIMFATIREWFSDVVYLSAKSKPKHLDCKAWLETEGMYRTIKKQFSRNWPSLTNSDGESAEVVVGNNVWECVHDGGCDALPKLKKFNSLRLSSDCRFSRVGLRVEGSSYLNSWTICVEPDSQAP